MKNTRTSYGFSFVELIVTMTIMMIFGSVGMMTITSLQNYFHVQRAEEKLTAALKEAKQTVLQGEDPCARVSVFKNDEENKKPTFFVVERWEQVFSGNQKFCEYNKNGTRTVSNFIENISVQEKNGDWVLAFQVKNTAFDGIVYPEAFTSSYKPVEVVDADGKTLKNGLSLADTNEFFVPMNNSQDYFVKIFDEMQAVVLTEADIHFYNANLSMIASEDPGTIEVENIEAKTRSAQKNSGNIEVVYEAPYGKGIISLLSNNTSFKATDVVIYFMNQNEAEGDLSFFNASILSGENHKLENNATPVRSTCILGSQSLELQCIK